MLICSFGVLQGLAQSSAGCTGTDEEEQEDEQRFQRIQLVTTRTTQKRLLNHRCCTPVGSSCATGMLCCGVWPGTSSPRAASSLPLHRDHHTPAQHTSSAISAMMQLLPVLCRSYLNLMPVHPPAAAVVPVFTQPYTLQSSNSESRQAGVHHQGYQMLTGAGVQPLGAWTCAGAPGPSSPARCPG